MRYNNKYNEQFWLVDEVILNASSVFLLIGLMLFLISGKLSDVIQWPPDETLIAFTLILVLFISVF